MNNCYEREQTLETIRLGFGIMLWKIVEPVKVGHVKIKNNLQENFI
jgi:hypothetical protein